MDQHQTIVTPSGEELVVLSRPEEGFVHGKKLGSDVGAADRDIARIISNLESGRGLTAEVRRRMAKALGVPKAWL